MKFSKKAVAIIICAVLLLGTVAAGGMIASADNSTSQTGDFIYFGSYPQSEVKDNATVAKLNKTLKAEDWRSYGYYSGTVELPEPTAWWRLRTPGGYSYCTCGVYDDGHPFCGDSTDYTCRGIRPAIELNLSSGISESVIIVFGSYPQSLVEDEKLIGHLNEAKGKWQSYGYYIGTGNSSDGKMIPSDFMRYKDIAYNGNKYRAVTFDIYRPYDTGYTQYSDSFNQGESGYYTGNVYWFRYEPLRWRVLDPGKGLVITETVIDSQAFNNYSLYDGDEYYGDADKTYYACDYANSSIRAWLNDDFINTAFSAAEQNSIKETELNNDGFCTTLGRSGYDAFDSASTNDKVFLLSYDESLNTSYFADDSSRTATSSDYAKCQGVSYWTEYEYDDFCNGEMKPSDFMRYADVTLNGIKYRAVTFDEYRPTLTGSKLGAKVRSDYQGINGYEKKGVYWFRYDPVKWRVLDPDKGLVLSDTVIDSQAYNNFIIKKAGIKDEKYAYFGDAGQTYYASDWAKSSLRKWLNNDFYNTAFTDYQKTNITETVNSVKGCYKLVGQKVFEPLDSADTTDKVFVLSYDELYNENYFKAEEGEIARGSDYAFCQGLSGSRYDVYFYCHLRNSCDFSDEISNYFYRATSYTCDGVRPALRLKNLHPEIEYSHEKTEHLAAAGNTVFGSTVSKNNYSGYKTVSKPLNPVANTYTFKSMTFEAPGNMTENNITADDMTDKAVFVNAETPEMPAPVFKEQNADYNTDVTIRAILRNIPSDAQVYIDGKKAEAGNEIYSANIGHVKSSKDVKVEIKQGENLLDTLTLRVNVDTGILSKLASFFSNFLFNLFKWKEVTLIF